MIAELVYQANDNEFLDKIVNHLEFVKNKRPEVTHLIQNGLDLIFEKDLV